MKTKTLSILLLLIPFLGFGQKVMNFTSDFIHFSYYDTYTIDDSRLYIDDPSVKSVKLTCNSCDYGALDNIMIGNLPIDGNEKINMMDFFKILKQESESQMLKMGVLSEFSLVRIGTESIKGSDIPYLICQNFMKDVGTLYQKIYVYQKQTTYTIILSTGTENDLVKRQGDVDLILETFNSK